MAPEATGLTPAQKMFYAENGYLVLKSVFAGEECEGFVEHLEDLHAGRKQLDGFFQREIDSWRCAGFETGDAQTCVGVPLHSIRLRKLGTRLATDFIRWQSPDSLSIKQA